MTRGRQGFTLVELLVVVLLLVPLWTAATALAVTTSRAAARAAALASAEAAVAQAAATLAAELTEIRPDRDLLLLEPARVRFQASRGTGLICRADSAGVVVPESSWAATRQPVPGRDVLELDRVAPDSAGFRETLQWPLIATPAAEPCSAFQPGLRLPADLTAATLPGFTWGPLARTNEVIELAAYTSLGQRWLGIRHLSLGTPIEPLAGPFAPDGVTFTGLDGTGNPAPEPAAVRLIRVRLATPGPTPVTREVEVGLRGG